MDTLLKNVLLSPFNVLYKINPKAEIGLMFRIKQGYWMDFNNPETFNEKLQWIKLYDRNPLMTKCSDKYAVREYVSEKGFGNLLNSLIWEGFHPEDIPFDVLPDKFVIKATHGSTFNMVCEDKSSLNREKVVHKLNKWLNTKFLPCYGEWFYGVERPRIIIEHFLDEDGRKSLTDYKVFCFHGEPKYILVVTDRDGNTHKNDVFTTDWQKIPDTNMGFPNSNHEIRKPKCFQEILDASAKLSEDFKHARVDFYIVDDQPYFGELTFTSSAGFDRFEPMEFDREMGKWLLVDT